MYVCVHACVYVRMASMVVTSAKCFMQSSCIHLTLSSHRFLTSCKPLAAWSTLIDHCCGLENLLSESCAPEARDSVNYFSIENKLRPRQGSKLMQFETILLLLFISSLLIYLSHYLRFCCRVT